MPEWFLNLDGGILLWLQEAVRNAVLTPLFTLYTHLGDSGLMWIALSVLLLCFKKTRKAGAAGLMALLLSLMVNARHMFYGLSMLDRYKGMGKARFPLIYMLCDETFSVVSTVEPPEGVDAGKFYLSVSLLDWSAWVTASMLGGVLGGVLPFDISGMDFALTALFVVLFLEQLRQKQRRLPGAIGIACAVVALLVCGPDNLVIPSMVLIFASLLIGRKKLCA